MPSRHPASLVLIFLAIVLIYGKAAGAYFCGFDDFYETQRAAFEDHHTPSHIFTTTHFKTSKYRPLNRALTYITYWAGNGNPRLFRVRNIVFHLLCAALVYGLGLLLFRSWGIALAGALLFGIQPVANQAVVGAVFTVAESDALILASLFSFVAALQTKRRQVLYLTLSMIFLWIDLFLYEASILTFALLLGYVAITWISGRRPVLDRRFLTIFAVEAVVVLGSFFAVRSYVVSIPTQIVPVGTIIKNAMLYMGALLLPVDLVLMHDLFDTPLPSEMHLGLPGTPVLACAAIAAVLLLAAAWFWRKQLARLEWPNLVFLCGAIGISLAPFLAFNPHPSETYLHLPSAFYALLLAAAARELLTHNWSYAAIVAVFGLLFTAGTLNRNARVASCGEIAQRIVSALPITHWRQNAWDIRMAAFPGEPLPTRYGIYEYHGLSAIDPGEMPVSSLEAALQMLTGNEQLKAKVVSGLEMREPCPRPGACFWVHYDGSVVEAGPHGATE